MKQQVSESVNGVQVENTLSMALQNPFPKRRKIWLILTAYTGVISSIFSFLTMFSPTYSLPVLLAVTTAVFLFFAYVSLHPHKSLVPVLTAVLGYCILFFMAKRYITSGLMYVTNNVCQAIYMTDWEYFVTDERFPELPSVTCVLCFLIFPIIWMICYSVLRYQNFFLSMLVTFPFIEIGLFFGIVPNHFFAGLMTAFWFAMASVQSASSGITQNGGKTGFLRKKNAFLPVSNMRFLLPEYTGIIMIFAVMLVFGATEFALYKSGYERPEEFKTLRTDFQNYIASLHLTDDPVLEDYGEVPEQLDDETHIPLGSLDEKIYENIPVTSIAFSANPETRIYLKYRTGHVYNGINWNPLPEEAYQNQNLDIFNQLDYYPPEFLYSTVTGGNPLQMSLYNTTGILAQCVPYGFQKNHNIICQVNDLIQTSTQNYTIRGRTDFEEILLNPDAVKKIPVQGLFTSCNESDMDLLRMAMNLNGKPSVWISENSKIVNEFYQYSMYDPRTAKAGILCGSFYDDFVYENYTSLPDSPSLQAVRTAYADLLSDFDGKNATPAEIFTRLELLRNKVCDTVDYTLAPGRTPANTDHTAYFLLENHKGYCEHYATAGTVLARMAGIPARYCEGYMIDCSKPGTLTETRTEDGSTAWTSEILDSNSHAWTEIYISGLGWIPFEFTFSYFTSHIQPEPEPVPVPETE
ncbi:MAG: transglutaminase domain-containing protein, partial [Ruminococcus sp.]|nr:transglutaminase domain-containing protein [Ruminococcus sp.]